MACRANRQVDPRIDAERNERNLNILGTPPEQLSSVNKKTVLKFFNELYV
jgi:hypothetical protein